MKNPQKVLILAACSCIVLAHFYRLSTYLINFPNWGDDLMYFRYVVDLPLLSWTDIWHRSFEFHGNIHRIPLSRIISAAYFYVGHEFNFKTLTILANGFMVILIYPLYQFIKKSQLGYWQIIPIIGLLFAPNGNLDNYALIGVLTHTASMAFLLVVCYWISQAQTRNLGIWISLAYPLVITDGLTFLLLVLLLLIYQKDSKFWIYGIFTGIIFTLYFQGYHSAHSSGISFNQLIFILQGAIIFIGGAVRHHYWTSLLFGSLMLIQTLILFYKYHASKDGHYLFISLAAFQIMAVGALITIGRGDADAGDIGVLFAERFLIYGTVFIVLIYLGLLQLGQQYFSKQTAYLAVPALLWIVVSWNAAIPKLENLHQRLIVDASNALVFNLNTMYEFQDREVNSLKHAGAYHFPNNLLKIQSKDKLTENVVLTPMPNFEKGIKEFEVNGEGTLLVTQNNKAFCFLHINSLSHSVKMKEDLPINIEKSSFSTIR